MRPGVVVTSIPINAPGERHTKCGDWIEGDECKSCGRVPLSEIEVR